MSEARHHRAEIRAAIRIAGPDARAFLQGIVSNDVEKVSPQRAVYAAFLTPQGKYLHDFFIAETDGALVVDCEAARRDDLLRRLLRFKLRSNVSVTASNLVVHLVFGEDVHRVLGLPPEAGVARALAGGVAYVDPRLAEAGIRAMLPAGADAALSDLGLVEGGAAEYEALRLGHGLPDGDRDLEVEKTILLEAGIDELNGVDWQKGCYLGQELTARTRYRGLIKKRLVPVRIDGPAPPPGTPIHSGATEAGTMRSSQGAVGLAMLRLDALAAPLAAGEARLRPFIPAWMKI